MSEAEELICVGDRVCLFCEDTAGYVVGYHSSQALSQLFIHEGQEKDSPKNLNNPHASVFEICLGNRYILTKRYRRLMEVAHDNLTEEEQLKYERSKLAADKERVENEEEYASNLGQPILFGQNIQLKHVITGRYLHISTNQPSKRDKNSMMIHLLEYNAKEALLKFKSRFRMKSDGDIVFTSDQVSIESFKSGGRFLKASESSQVNSYLTGSELMLSVGASAFSLKKYTDHKDDSQKTLRGGVLVSLFHCEEDGHIAAQGRLHGALEEDAHLRVEAIDPNASASAEVRLSAKCYWQVIQEESTVKGDSIKWEQQLRLRHAITSLYLKVDANEAVTTTSDISDPRTVFRIYNVMEETEFAEMNSFCYIRHVLSSTWLNVSSDEKYEPDSDEYSFKWDLADKKLLCVTPYEDLSKGNAFMIQDVELAKRNDLNYMTSSVHFLLSMVERIDIGEATKGQEGQANIKALGELKDYMMVDGEPVSARQELIMHTRMADLLVECLKKIPEKSKDRHSVVDELRFALYDVLEMFLAGEATVLELYLSKYIGWFLTQVNIVGPIGWRTTAMLTELVMDNRVIIDKYASMIIENTVSLLAGTKEDSYLDLLGATCMCDGMAIPDNQTQITQSLLENSQGSMYTTRTGKDEKTKKKTIMINVGGSEISLIELCSNEESDEYKYFLSQLRLFSNLCAGRNGYCTEVITVKCDFLSWQEALMCLSDDDLLPTVRAKYAELIENLFVDAGLNRSVLNNMTPIFPYESLGFREANERGVVLANGELFAPLSSWITSFLDNNKDMTASETGHNVLVKTVLHLVHELIKFGYYRKRADFLKLVEPLVNLLDGRNDKPNSKVGKEINQKALEEYRNVERFEKNAEAKFISNAKFSALECIDLLLKLQSHHALEKFLTVFKTRNPWKDKKDRPISLIKTTTKKTNIGQMTNSDIDDILESSSFIDKTNLTTVLLDLANYNYDNVVRKALHLINILHMPHSVMFELAKSSMVLTSEVSLLNHETVQGHMMVLRQCANNVIGDDDTRDLLKAYEYFISMCQMGNDPDVPHVLNQSMLLCHGVLDVSIQQLKSITWEMEEDAVDDENTCAVLNGLFKVLAKLCSGNSKVQSLMMENYELLLKVNGNAESDVSLAKALLQIFLNNKDTCMALTETQIELVLKRICKNRGGTPEFIQLLFAFTKVESLDMQLLRNMNIVMISMVDKYRDTLRPLDADTHWRLSLLQEPSEENPDILYLMNLVDLVATCSEADNAKMEHVCQGLMPLDEISVILNDAYIPVQRKRPFVRYITEAFIKTRLSQADSGVNDLTDNIIPFIRASGDELMVLSTFCNDSPVEASAIISERNGVYTVSDQTEEGVLFTCIRTATLPFIESFYTSSADFDGPAVEGANQKLALALMSFIDAVSGMAGAALKQHLTDSLQAVLTRVDVTEEMRQTLNTKKKKTKVKPIKISENPAKADYEQTHATEENLTQRLQSWAGECESQFRGENTVQAQLGVGESDKEYTNVGSDEELPLGPGFQSLVSLFHLGRTGDVAYVHTKKLVRQLYISGYTLGGNETEAPEQVQLDLTCMRILRALIHNQVVLLPGDGTEFYDDEQMEGVLAAQKALNENNAIVSSLPHISRKQDEIVGEFLAFITSMLFRANKDSQQAFVTYFFESRQDTLINSLKERLDVSQGLFKARKVMEVATAKFNAAAGIKDKNDSRGMTAKESGHIELLFKVMANMCDGQNKVIQDYMRVQGDNMGSVNIVMSTAEFMRTLYTNVNKGNCDIFAQLLSTLNEMATGNPENHAVIFDAKVVDGINFVLRGNMYGDSSMQQIVELKGTMGTLLYSMTEENLTVTGRVKGICKALDFDSAVQVLLEMHNQIQKNGNDDWKETCTEIGLTFYYLVLRIQEVNPGQKTTPDKKVWKKWIAAKEHFQGTTRTVEIMKDDALHKVRFRVRDKGVLRSAVREMVKWQTDRTSPSNKIRDLVEWSEYIIDDVSYQSKIRASAPLRFLCARWDLWNNMVFLLSIILNTFMLVVWRAEGSIGKTEVPSNATQLPKEILNPHPIVPSWYTYVHYSIGGVHLFFCVLVTLTYFIAGRPKPPNPIASIKAMFVSSDEPPVAESPLRDKFFSVKTFYYTSFVVFSVLGLLFDGYCYGFHLLNITHNNLLLQGAFKAITLNVSGLSNTFALGVIVIYLFALLAFGFFRFSFDPDYLAYCSTLYECTFTIFRYGFMGGFSGLILPHPLNNSFPMFFGIAILHLLFYLIVGVIGLNIIFGIILDSFNQLRGAYDASQSDMQGTCFICARLAFEFETQAKGFNYHVQEEHCMWDYIYLILYINETPTVDLSVLELHVHNQLEAGDTSFFPIGQAMCLEAQADDSTAILMDQMMGMLRELLSKQASQDVEKQKQLVKQQQGEWEQFHRTSENTSIE